MAYDPIKEWIAMQWAMVPDPVVTGPACDVCGSHARVKAWSLRPGDLPARRRYLCDRCGRALDTAYNAARAPRGSAAISRRVVR